MHRNRNHDDLIHSILIYSWPNKTQITSTSNIYETPYITQKFIHIQSLAWDSGWLNSRPQCRSEMCSRCWHRLSSWLFPGNQTGHYSFFITGMPHVLTQHISSGMKTSENREEETEPSTLVQCFDARFGCVGCRAAFSRQTNGPEEKLVPCKGYSSGHSVQHMDMGTTSTCRKRSFSLFLPPA